jgi:hypothetical protein
MSFYRYFESKISVETHKTVDHPFGRDLFYVEDPLDDLRLATAGITMVDLISDIVAYVVFTNKSIYAIYGRLEWVHNGGFLHAIPIGRRNWCEPLNDYEIVGIGYSRNRGSLRWYIRGHVVLEVPQVGNKLPTSKIDLMLDTSGLDQNVCPHFWWVGFGTFSFLDAHKPNNKEVCDNYALCYLDSDAVYRYPIRPDPITGKPVRDIYFNYCIPTKCNRIWGQGATLRLQYMCIKHRYV